MSLIILSALGTGPYRPANYKSEHQEEVITTGLFAVALQQWYPKAKIKLLATKTAQEGANGEFVRQNHSDFEFVSIPESRTEAEAWELFQVIADHIPEGSRVIFDITHSLRSLPMLGFLALSYLRVVKKVTIERVFYGALDLTPRIEGALTPVVDLTPFVALLDWASAAKRFEDTGDARLFKPLIRKQGRSPLINVANKLDILSTALANNRTLETAGLATELEHALNEAKEQEMLIQHRPFLSIMTQIEEVISPLQGSKEVLLELRAYHAQILWYYTRGHHVQAIGLAREWLVSVLTWKKTGETQLSIVERSEAEHFLGRYAKTPTQAPEEYQAICALWDKITTLRNDLLHFGMRPTANRTKAAGVEKSVQSTIDALPAAVRPLGLELELPAAAT